jgi:hypothetical protein
MDACDMERTLSLARSVPWNPYEDGEITLVISPPRAHIARERMARSAPTVRSLRREAEIRAIVHRVIFAIGFVTTGMLIGALIGLWAVGFYS